MRKITKLEKLYIDFDAFFANVEKQLHPPVRECPVGVTSLPSEQATLITCCYQAKRAGVRRGMRVFQAREICPGLVVRPARHDIYVDIHNKILAEISRHIPITKVWSIDEAECTLKGREQTEASDLAKRIRQGLKECIGPYVTPSIGIAPNQFLAKVAAEMNKPDGLTILPAESLPGPLLKLDLSDLPGISSNMSTRLNDAGIICMQDFWDIEAKHARAIWGNVEGERMWAQLHGYAVSRPATQRRMFGHSRMLSGQWQTPDKAKDCLHLLTVKAAYRMRREAYTAKQLSISLRHETGRLSAETQFPACNDDYSLSHHMHRLYESMITKLGSRIRIRGVYVMLSDIMLTGQHSGDLFDDVLTNAKMDKWNKLTRTMDTLNEKHGTRLVHLGPKIHLPGGYAGAKIAFGRVPDKGDFF